MITVTQDHLHVYLMETYVKINVQCKHFSSAQLDVSFEGNVLSWHNQKDVILKENNFFKCVTSLCKLKLAKCSKIV